MSQPRAPFPQVGSWAVAASGFDPGVVEHVPAGSRMEVSEAVEGWAVTIAPPEGPARTFPCRVQGNGGLETSGGAGDEGFVLRLAAGDRGRSLLVGVWLRRGRIGDTAIGVWVSEEDNRRPEGRG